MKAVTYSHRSLGLRAIGGARNEARSAEDYHRIIEIDDAIEYGENTALPPFFRYPRRGDKYPRFII